MGLMETRLSLQRVEQNLTQPDQETIVWQVLQEKDGKINALDFQKKPMQFPHCMLKKETIGRRADQGRSNTHSSAVKDAFTLYEPKNRKWTDSESQAMQGASEESSEIEYSSGSDLEDGKGHRVNLKGGKRHHVSFCENVIVGMAAQGNASVSEAEEDYEGSVIPDSSAMDVEEVSATSEKRYRPEIPSVAKSKLHTHPGLLQEGGENGEEEDQNNMSDNMNSLYAVQKERRDKEQGTDNDNNIITIIDLEMDVPEFNPTTETKKYNVDDPKLDYMSLDNDLQFGTDSLMLMARSVAGGEMVGAVHGRRPWQCATGQSSTNKGPPTKRRMLGLSQPSVYSGPQSLATEVPREELGGQGRRRTSYVWEHFDEHAQDRLIAVCRLCHAFVRLGREGGCRRVGTTSMIKHLEHRHPHIVPPQKEVCQVSTTPPPNPLVKEVPQTNRAESEPTEKPQAEPPGGKSSAPSGQKQLSVPEACLRPEKYALHSAIAARYNRALARYITQSMLPFSVVEDETFLEFLKELAPHWKSSTLYMLERLLEQKKAVNEYIQEKAGDLASTLYMQPDQWFIIEDLVDILQIFNECTAVLSSENATLGVVLPALHVMEFSLERKIEEMQNRPGTAANQNAMPAVVFAAQLLESLHNNKHLMGIRADLKYLAATFLKPRYRNSIRDRLRSTGDNQFWSLQEYIIKKSVHFYKKLHNSTGRAMAEHSLPSYAFSLCSAKKHRHSDPA
ncbi:hypothetical protein JD844_013741 [Phrynosoma platyrhinos]|uniref:BED-type domain-containing protein n=1 Tax=Phrynosoma platyrhinos TaxID=52577 RepID=A0ABQ7TL97_PHRPL|nr:hypothetical protein JD844_013741 [Phrynosoma platyrhinos]